MRWLKVQAVHRSYSPPVDENSDFNRGVINHDKEGTFNTPSAMNFAVLGKGNGLGGLRYSGQQQEVFLMR
jgi:hypothetical protein